MFSRKISAVQSFEPSSSSKFSPSSTTTHTMSEQIFVLMEVFKRCDPVSTRRSAEVCRRWRQVIASGTGNETNQSQGQNNNNNNKQMHDDRRLRIAHFGRIYVTDRKRIILERLRTKIEVQEEAEIANTRMRHGIQPGFSMSNSKNGSLKVLQMQPPSQMDSVYVDERVADSSQRTSWAFSWNIRPWIDEYDIQEVVFHNFCAFLEREITEMADPTPIQSTSREALLTQSHGSSAYLHTPSYSPGNSPSHNGVIGTQPSTPMNQPQQEIRDVNTLPDVNIWNGETMEELLNLSSGRIERLAQVLSAINPLHLVIKDTTRRMRRPIRIVFFAIKLLRNNLRRLTLENLTGNETVELAKWLSLGGLEKLVIKQPSSHTAFTVNEQLLFKWLRLPETRRTKINIEFHGCRELTAEGLAKFIKAWQLTPEICEFETIKIDCATLQPVEFLAVVSKKPNERLSSTLFEEFSLRAALNHRKMIFQHERNGAVIKFSADQKMMTLQCVRTQVTQPMISRRSAPLIQTLEHRHQARLGAHDGKGSLANLLSTGDVGGLVKSLFASPESRKRVTQIA
ncbi:unnamed protein product, partial [Mesorhabditis belari]|uniref:F-box domain-containing protein n=1 Tax=Mesorhabditis belari TaxID=2138241 RepID=A0AAF3FR65_9BILA